MTNVITNHDNEYVIKALQHDNPDALSTFNSLLYEHPTSPDGLHETPHYLNHNNSIVHEAFVLEPTSNGPTSCYPQLAPLSLPEESLTPRTTQLCSPRPLPLDIVSARSRDRTTLLMDANSGCDKVFDGLLVDLQGSLRHIRDAVDLVTRELLEASASMVNQTLETHWNVIISRLECLSLAFFLGLILFFLMLFNMGPIIY